MGELRRDPVTGRLVCLAPARALRPESRTGSGLGHSHLTTPEPDCPFCPGNEDKTPPELAAVRNGGPPDSPGWRVRTVPNLYPAFTAEDGPAVAGDALHQALPARGACEVIIHSPDHHRWLPYLSADQAALIMSTTWRRYRHNASRGVASVVVLYNHGTGAGASLEHPHGQLYATTEASPLIDEEVAGAARYRARDGGCVFCGIVAHEEADGSRLIGADGDFVMLAPWASREPFECWIIPREHHPDFGLADERAAGALGRSLRVVLWRISRELDDPDLNWYIHSLPHASGDKAAAYHWHVEIRPRIGEVAGFELATGTYINTVAPEAAAAALKARPDPGPQQQERFP